MEITRQSDYYGLGRKQTASFDQNEVQDLLKGKAIMAGLNDRSVSTYRERTDHDRAAQGHTPGPHLPRNPALVENPRPSTPGDRGLDALQSLTSAPGFDPEQHFNQATDAAQGYAKNMFDAEPWTRDEEQYHEGPNPYEDSSHTMKTYPSRDDFYRERGVSGI